jgi:hypothetical protein
VSTVGVDGQMFGSETVNASPEFLTLCAACLPRPRSPQISDLAAVPGLPSIGRQMSGAPPAVYFIRALAHLILEATGASFRATIVAVTGSKDAPDERVLPPIPIFARQNRGPYNISDDLVIEYPQSDGRVSDFGVFCLCANILPSSGKSQENEVCSKESKPLISALALDSFKIPLKRS